METHSTSSGQARNCTKCQQGFTLDADDFAFYDKMAVPAPKVCPDCRFKMRALFRNETTLYSGRKCDLCSKGIVTMYNPKSPYKVYCLDCYKSDKWDFRSHAQEYDLERPFFDQLKELFEKVPKAALFDAAGFGPNVRSDFVNASASLKDCYLVFNTGPAENTYYSRGVDGTNEVSDGYFSTKDEQCYEIVNVHDCNKVSWSQNLKNCVDCYFCEDLSGCINCFGCVGLRNKSNHIYNEQVTKEQYDAFMKDFVGSYERQQVEKEKFRLFRLKFPKRENHNLNTVNSLGDYLNETKNVRNSFEIRGGGEDSKYCFSCKGIKDSYGLTGYGVRSEMLLECTSTGNSSRAIGCYAVDQSTNMEYSFSCRSSNHDCIGCDGAKNAEFCILNKQYSKEEYQKLHDHIVAELKSKDQHGLMMPPELAPFAYNETIAHDNMPMTKEEVVAAGFRWEDDIQVTKGKETLLPEQIPDHIKDISDAIINEILKCVDCERNYKIVSQEFLFYQKMQLPIPRRCFYCRHKDRIRCRGPYQFWQRECAHCGKGIITNNSPERPEIVYCESCYQKEVL